MNNRSQLFACLSYSSQSWFRDVLLYPPPPPPPSMCQISRQSDIAFAFIAVFVSVRKEEENKKKKTKKLIQFLESHISGTLEAISLKFGMWSAEVGGHVHSKNCLVSLRQHRATEVRKLRFRSSCQYTHGCCAPASWATRHTTVCLDTYKPQLLTGKMQYTYTSEGIL